MRSLSLTLAAAAVSAMPLLAQAGTVDTPACKRDLSSASAGVAASQARLKGVARAAVEVKCEAYRQQFLIVVKARDVFANCKTGPDRDADVNRLDGTIEDINGGIATSCTQ
jgi:hypothetical protein